MEIIWTKNHVFFCQKKMLQPKSQGFKAPLASGMAEALTNLISLHDLTTSRAAQFFGGPGLGGDNQNR